MLRLLVFLLFAALGQAQTAPATDAQIEAKLHDKLAKSLIGKDGFIAKVKAGVVYWEGSTAVAQHKGAATRMAKSSGARRVVNNIQVKKSVEKVDNKAAPAKQAVAAPPPPPQPPADLKRVTVKWR
jgi:hypothetical protein